MHLVPFFNLFVRPVTLMLYRSSAYAFYFRMMPALASVRGARFVKVMLTGLMTVLHGIISACELVLKTNVFRFLVSTPGLSHHFYAVLTDI
jgi:hypothetical protein